MISNEGRQCRHQVGLAGLAQLRSTDNLNGRRTLGSLEAALTRASDDHFLQRGLGLCLLRNLLGVHRRGADGGRDRGHHGDAWQRLI
jgi:hypothetical protein